MPTCICGLDYAYYDRETNRKFNSNELPHACQSKPIPLYETFNGIVCRRNEGYIAADITRAAQALGLNPFRVRTVKSGDFLIVKA